MQSNCDDSSFAMALAGVSAVFESLGRLLICLDRDFRIVHVSHKLNSVICGEANRAIGRPAQEFLGDELFGDGGTLRDALLSGERREGWRAIMCSNTGASTLMSVTAAPFIHPPGGICDPRVAYIVVLRPADEEQTTNSGAPTVFGGLTARSASMDRIFQLIQNLEASDATILLTGESGTGKEMIARAIHAHSSRRHGPFVAVNCGGLPGDLLESELFGHVRGAFTSAVRDRVGRFELASNGTLFLDEIGDLPLHLQVKLLRVLQEKTFERVGESQSRKTSARIIAATNIDLRRAVLENHFRDDLYYRLRVVPIEIPPLRERREDIEPLARALLARVSARHGRSLRFSPDALRALLRYNWPGNVREMENALEYSIAVCRGQTVHPEDLPVEIVEIRRPHRETFERDVVATAPSESEAVTIRHALESVRWCRNEAAKRLGMSRTTLWRKMRELNLVDH